MMVLPSRLLGIGVPIESLLIELMGSAFYCKVEPNYITLEIS